MPPDAIANDSPDNPLYRRCINCGKRIGPLSSTAIECCEILYGIRTATKHEEHGEEFERLPANREELAELLDERIMLALSKYFGPPPESSVVPVAPNPPSHPGSVLRIQKH